MVTRLRWVDAILFRGTGRQWTISNHLCAARSPYAGIDSFLEARSGEQLRLRRPGTWKARRGSCVTAPTGTMQMWRENGGLSIQFLENPRVILLY
jgi:hypothetical protein